MKTKRDYASFDFLLLLLVAGLCLFGLIIIPSAGGGLGISADKFSMQRVWIASGFVIMLAAAFIPYEFICKFYVPIYIVNIVLLLATLALKKYTGEKIWRDLGMVTSSGVIIGPSIMPSEFAKLFTIISLSAFIDKYKDKINNILILGAIVGTTGLTFLLIAMQPSLSASSVTLVIMVVMLFTAKLSYKYIIFALSLVVLVGGVIYYDLNTEEHRLVRIFLQPYQIEDRLMPFVTGEADPDDEYQLKQSQAAISSGQLYGTGLSNNKIHVPESTNDYVFSIIAAEFGFFGAMAVITTGFLIVFRCLLTAWRSELFMGRLIAAGAAGMFGFHIFVNVGVATGLVPVTGITFPFISTGGSSIWISMACVGLVLNVNMTKTKSMFE